jgi:hypothetical protein
MIKQVIYHNNNALYIKRYPLFHIPIYFVNFVPENILNIQDFFNTLFNVLNYSLPVLFLISFLLSLASAANRTPFNNIMGRNKLGNNFLDKVFSEKGRDFNEKYLGKSSPSPQLTETETRYESV